MTEKSELVQELEDKVTRDAFVSSQMSIPLAFQIQALREQQGLTQKQLAEKAGMLQPRIAAMERPSGSEPNLRTLKRLASAFDVALIVRFAPFSELVEWAESFSPDAFVVPSFNNDPGINTPEITHADNIVDTKGQLHISPNVDLVLGIFLSKKIDFNSGTPQGAESFVKIFMENIAKSWNDHVANTVDTSKSPLSSKVLFQPVHTHGAMPTRLPTFELKIVIPQTNYGGESSDDRAA